MGERLEKLKAMLKKEQERRIKLNNRIAILERRIQEESAAEVADMVRTANVTPEQLAEIMRSMFGDRLVPELPKDVTSASAKSDTPVPLPDEEVMDDDDDA